MEQVFLVMGVICLVLAAASLVACVVIFFRMDVLNAIRFLRNKPMKGRAKSSRTRSGGAGKKKGTAKSGGEEVARPTANADGSDKALATERVVVASPKKAVRPAEGAEEESELPTGLLSDESEAETGLLEEDSEQPTGLLDEQSEQPTGLLEEDSEQPTGLLEEDSEQPTGLLEEDSEQPTGLLEEQSEQPTGLLSHEVPDTAAKGATAAAAPSGRRSQSSVVQHGESSFRFTLKRNVVVIHTDEVIE